MPSTFFGLNISYSGLVASNAALNTTANNISNVNTEGYSKQNTVTQASDALRTFAAYGCAGAGVDTLAIERLRNTYYDTRFWNNHSNLGQHEVKKDYMRMMEDYFADDEYTTGFNTIFGNVFKGLEEVMKNAGDVTFKQAFITQAYSLSEYFNSLSTNLHNMQKDLNQEVKTTVDQINAFASEIATINEQINVVELGGGRANELRDQRGAIIDKLSQLVDVETTENPIYDTNNPDRETGGTRYVVKIAGGQTLVDSNNYFGLECVARSNSERKNLNDINGIYDIKWSNGNNFDLNNARLGGKLKGLVDMRDGNNGEYFHGTIGSLGYLTDSNGVLHQTVTVDVDASYLKEFSKCTVAPNGVITLANQDYHYDSFSFSYDETTGKYSYNFVINSDDTDKQAISSSRIGKEANIGIANEYEGVPYYLEQMNEWVRDFAKAFNEIETQDGAVDGYGNPAINFFVANSLSDEKQYTFKDEVDMTHSFTIQSEDDTYYRLTAESFTIDRRAENDANYFGTHTTATDGQDKFDVVEQLIDLQTNKDKMSFRGCSSSEFLQCIMADVALNANSANNFTDKYECLEQTIDTLRLSISGVDQDEEAADLLKFQNAYTLASKMINTFQQIYDRLITQTGV